MSNTMPSKHVAGSIIAIAALLCFRLVPIWAWLRFETIIILQLLSTSWLLLLVCLSVWAVRAQRVIRFLCVVSAAAFFPRTRMNRFYRSNFIVFNFTVYFCRRFFFLQAEIESFDCVFIIHHLFTFWKQMF